MKASTQGLLIAGGISTLAVLVYIIIRQINKQKTTIPLSGYPITTAGDPNIVIGDPNVPNPDPVAVCREAEAMAGMTEEEMRERIFKGDVMWFAKLTPEARQKVAQCPLIAEMLEKVK